MDSALEKRLKNSFVFDMFTYMDEAVYGHNYEGKTLEYIVDDLQQRMDNGDSNAIAQKDAIQIVQSAMKNDADLKNAKLLSLSRTNLTSEWKDDKTQGAAFQVKDDYYVSYRGTGEGRWRDNSKGLTLESTDMEQKSAAYLDEVVEKTVDENSISLKDKLISGQSHLYVGGHSKGGDESEASVFLSQYGYLVDETYSIDGQGHSDKAIRLYKEKYGDDYVNRVRSMYAFNGENDPVHQMGKSINPGENIYYLYTDKRGIIAWHDMKYMFGNKDGEEWVYDGPHWFRDENDEITNGIPGPGAWLGKAVNDRLNELDENTRDGVASVAMSLIDMISGNKDLSEYDLTLKNWIDFIYYGIPILEQEVFLTEEGWIAISKVIETVLMSNIENMKNEGTEAAVILTLVEVAAAALVIPPILGIVSLARKCVELFERAYENVMSLVETMKKMTNYVKEVADKFFQALQSVISRTVEFFKAIDPGVRYANENPHIIVDTRKMYDYSSRLMMVNRRIAALDRRMDYLYGKVGLQDLWNLIQADLLTSYSIRLVRCAEYLNDTAHLFEEADKKIQAKL